MRWKSAKTTIHDLWKQHPIQSNLNENEVRPMTKELKIRHLKASIIALQAEFVQYMKQYTIRMTLLKDELKRVKGDEKDDD